MRLSFRNGSYTRRTSNRYRYIYVAYKITQQLQFCKFYRKRALALSLRLKCWNFVSALKRIHKFGQKLKANPLGFFVQVKNSTFLTIGGSEPFPRGSRTRRKVFELASGESSGCVMHERGRCMFRKRGGRNEERREEGMGGKIKMVGVSFRRTRGQKRLRASVIFSENNVGQPRSGGIFLTFYFR